MAGTTARYGFPYQEGTDPPDGASLGQDLAESVETSLGALADKGYMFLQQVRFTSSGTFTKASYPTARLARVRVVGGGGAGAGAPATAAATVAAGGGGQAGAYAESLLTVSGLASSVTVTRGAGGAGASGASGNNGATSSFGAHVVAGGGSGGTAGTAGGTLFPAVGGDGSQTMTGDIQVGGGAGTPGIRLGSVTGQVVGGTGGSNPLGSGGGPGASATGSAGYGYGGGGGGVANNVSQTAKTGGAGSNGIIIIDLYS